MRLKWFISLIVLGLSSTTFAQSELKPITWVVRPSFGINIPIKKLSGGHITDNLVGFDNNKLYWQFISTTYFFSNLGIEFSFAGHHNCRLTSKYEVFLSEVHNKYSANYFVTANSGAQYSGFNPISGTTEKGSIGPVYKIEHGTFVLIGRALIGVTSFRTQWGSATLKGRGTNELMNIKWSTKKLPKDYFSFNPSFTLGYRISDRIILDFDVNYWIYNIDFHYTEIIENQNTGIKQLETYNYSDLIIEASVGFGIMFVLK